MLQKGSRIYIAGPLTKGNQLDNVSTAINIYNQLISLGYYPFCPHFSYFANIVDSKEYEVWINQDLKWLEVCDAVYRFEGESEGADGEVKFAEQRGLPVYLDFSLMTGYNLDKVQKTKTALDATPKEINA
jgi:hypothetical protein